VVQYRAVVSVSVSASVAAFHGCANLRHFVVHTRIQCCDISRLVFGLDVRNGVLLFQSTNFFSIRAPGRHVYFQPVVPAGEEAKWGVLTSVPGTTVVYVC
jgi:hypothetical protein